MYHLKEVIKDSGENLVRPLGDSYSFFTRSSHSFEKAFHEYFGESEGIKDECYGILLGLNLTKTLTNKSLYYIMGDDGKTIERL